MRKRPAKVGIVTIVIALGLAWITGANPLQMLGLVGNVQSSLPSGGAQVDRQPAPAPDDAAGEFVSIVLADMEDIWKGVYSGYKPAKLVLFTDAVSSACGNNTASTGPFYCPADQKVYIDLGFMDDLKRFGASGDFALAYIIGHEVGHHVQNLAGTSSEVRRMQQRASRAQGNELSVALELQADCYAGVWAHHSRRRGTIEYDAGDLAEGIRAASSVGDDRMQKMAGRRVQPESFTHGASEQRVAWLQKGLETGDPEACNTFE